MSARVGVIIPNYNHASFLTERINSVLNQTFQDIDVYILDDKSSDNSKDIIEKYRNNPRVKTIIYNEENSGSSFIQWNRGILVSDNELIWIAESDDICDIHLLENLVVEFDDDKNCVLAFSNSVFVNANGVPTEQSVSLETLHMSGIDFIHSNMYRANTVKNASSALFKRTAALNVGQDYTSYKGAGDWLFWVEIAKQGNIAWVRKPFNYFRQHENTTKRLYVNGTTFKELKRLFTIFESRGYINTSIKKHILNSNVIFLMKDVNFLNKEIEKEVNTLFEFSCIDYLYYYLRIVRLFFISRLR